MWFGLEGSTDRRVGTGWARRIVGRWCLKDVSDDCVNLFSAPSLVQALSQFRPLLILGEFPEQRRGLFAGSPIREARLQPVRDCAWTAYGLNIIRDAHSKD